MSRSAASASCSAARMNGMFGLRDALCLLARLRQQAIDRRARREHRRFDADDLAIDADAGVERRARGPGKRFSAREPRLGLGDVGQRDLAVFVTLARLAQLFLQNRNIAFLKFKRRGIAQHVHIGRDGLEQYALLGQAQPFASGEDARFRRTRFVLRLEPVEYRLLERQMSGARNAAAVLDILRNRGIGRVVDVDVPLLRHQTVALHAEIAVACNARPHAGLRLRHSSRRSRAVRLCRR